MKKILLPAAALILSATAMNAYAVNGKVEFTGEIVKSTCNVVSGDQDKQVFIGKYPTTAFTQVGDVTASKAFTIQLEKCEAGDYSLRFDGQTVAGHSNLLTVNPAKDTSLADGVGIEVLDNNEQIIPVNQSADANSPWVTIAADGTATFNLKARYKSFDTVQAGPANANATFTIEYK